jgi:hypothetical protein
MHRQFRKLNHDKNSGQRLRLGAHLAVENAVLCDCPIFGTVNAYIVVVNDCLHL